MKQSVILFAAALAFAACSQDSEDRSQDSNIIQLSAAISGGDGVKAGTRADGTSSFVAQLQNTQFETGKQVFVEVYDHSTGNTYTESTKSFTVAADQGSIAGSRLLNGTIYYPATGSSVDICAYYPHTVTSSTTQFPSSGTIADQTTIANYQDFDLMYATKLTEKTKGERHSLTFNHAMAQIIVNIVPDDDSKVTASDITAKVSSVKIKNTVPVAQLTIANGVITAAKKSGATTDDIEILGSNDGNTKATSVGIIVPQTVTAGEFIDITYAGTTHHYSLESSKDFDGGYKYVYTFKMKAAGIELQSLKITDWAADPAAVEGNSGSGDFTI